MKGGRKYKNGYVINGRIVIGYSGNRYLMRCQLCGMKTLQAINQIEKHNCKCREKSKRFSGMIYDNPPEKIEAIKEKYKNGVTKEILQELFEKLK